MFCWHCNFDYIPKNFHIQTSDDIIGIVLHKIIFIFLSPPTFCSIVALLSLPSVAFLIFNPSKSFQCDVVCLVSIVMVRYNKPFQMWMCHIALIDSILLCIEQEVEFVHLKISLFLLLIPFHMKVKRGDDETVNIKNIARKLNEI